jgi:hypothetical protein
MLRLIFTLLLLTSSSAFAAKGVVLAEGDIYRVNSYTCGRIDGLFFSGTILKTGRFYSYKKQIADLNKAIRKATGSTKTKLQKKRKNVRAKKTEADTTCLALQNNTPLPNATTYEASTSFSSLNVETIDTILTGYCPANFELATIWGDFTYTHDSSICTAAVHAGVISLASGGNVIAKLKSGLDAYPSVERNGVTSSSWPSWPYAFVFLNLNNYEEVLS